eukprot:CAMPEP_0194269334 /NCGR_PEP_ID=MMETSP0169-20130528/3522_1 /TAXON_ID=218684 /ORGANISM="Corethron pennatum, Strain L29A3" /LENGTH=552 /DNA_ID=CAMNT_0039010951 /DNA_START=74 /DNA_END=1728 /DNA_ORIENTATION=+
MKFHNLVFTFMAVFLKKVFAQLEYSHDHLTCFRIKDNSLKLQGVVLALDANQAQKEFTIQKCELAQNKGALRMCVPSTKKVQQGFTDPSLGGLVAAYDPERCLQNDFLCYKATCTKTNKQRFVADQFNKKGLSRKAKFLKKGIEICTPAWKITKKGNLVVVECGTPTAGPSAAAPTNAPFPSGPSSSAPTRTECATPCTSSALVKLTPPAGTVYSDFGRSAVVSGDTLVIGSHESGSAGTKSGAAYVFSRMTSGAWVQTQRLVASDVTPYDYFAWDSAFDGDTMVFGSTFNSVGAAYVFTFQAGLWTETQKLTAADGAMNDYFGRNVAVRGDTLVVGAYGDQDWGPYSGSAYVFSLQSGTWVQTAKLVAPVTDGAMQDNFGESVAVSPGLVAVGARFQDEGGHNAGAVYVYTPDTLGSWTLTQKLLASDGGTMAKFGESVAMSGGTIAVGAPCQGCPNVVGSVYVFSCTVAGACTETDKLLAADGAASDKFGASVAISCNTIVVGAAGDEDNGGESGSAYIFTRQLSGGWLETDKIVPTDGALQDLFGWHVA